MPLPQYKQWGNEPLVAVDELREATSGCVAVVKPYNLDVSDI